jgi:hypothetical protein
VLGRARLALDHLHADGVAVCVDHRNLEAVRLDRGERLLHTGDVLRVGLDQAVLDHEARGRSAEVGAQPRRPTLEIVECAREPPVLRLGELLRLPGAVRDLHVLDPLAHEEILELRLLLHVLLPTAELDAVERRHSDEHVAALDELGIWRKRT